MAKTVLAVAQASARTHMPQTVYLGTHLSRLWAWGPCSP